MAAPGLRLTIRPTPDDGLRAALGELKQGYATRLTRAGLERWCRRAARAARAELARHRVSGAYHASVGYKVARNRFGELVGVVGGRHGFLTTHPAFGYRPAGAERQDTPGTNDPPKIGHLVEGGRRAVAAKKAKVLAIVVPTLDPRRAAGVPVAGGTATRKGVRGGKPRAIKVRGGFLIFARSAAAASPKRPIDKARSTVGAGVLAADLAAAVSEGLPRLAARAAARGSSVFRG